MIVQGKDIILKVSGVAIAASRTCSIDVDGEFIPVSDPLSAGAKKYIFKRYGWKLATQCICKSMISTQTFLKYAKSGTLLQVEYTDTTTNLRQMGEAFVSSVRNEGSIKSLATVSLELLGSGELYGQFVDKPTEFGGIVSRVLNFTSNSVYFASDSNGDLYYADIYFDSPGYIDIDPDGDRQNWVVCRGHKQQYNQIIEDERTFSTNDIVQTGNNNGRVYITSPGWYCVLTDDSVNNPYIHAAIL